MSNIVVSGLTAARDAATKGVTAAIHCYIWAGRKVELYSHKYLPELAAKVVSAVMWTLPYTAAAVFAPKFVFFAGSVLLIGFWNGIGKDLEETIGKEQRQHLFNGLRNGSMIRAAVVIHSVAVAATSGWVVAVALQCLFIGYQAHLIARQDAPPPPPAAEPATTGA